MRHLAPCQWQMASETLTLYILWHQDSRKVPTKLTSTSQVTNSPLTPLILHKIL